MRNAATHRLLIAHDGVPPETSSWLRRIDYAELLERSLEQAELARAALVYLLRAIDAHEHHLQPDRTGPAVELPTFDVDPELTELG
jgi:hypothetical protein